MFLVGGRGGKQTNKKISVLCGANAQMALLFLAAQQLYVTRGPCMLQAIHLRGIKCDVTPASVQASPLQQLASP